MLRLVALVLVVLILVLVVLSHGFACILNDGACFMCDVYINIADRDRESDLVFFFRS